MGAQSNRPGGTLALAYTMTPQRLLGRLVGPAGVVSGSMAPAVLQGAGAWWCGPVSVGVACASWRALLTESVAQGRKGRAQTLLAQLAVDRWQSVDLVGGWRSQAAARITLGVLRLGSGQTSAQVWLRDRELDRVVLPSYRRGLRRVLLDQARREREALGAHCDRLSGRLENVREVSACLAADDCVKLSRCLVQAFTPKK